MGRKRNIFDIVTGEKTTTHKIMIKYVKCQGRGSLGRTQQEHDPCCEPTMISQGNSTEVESRRMRRKPREGERKQVLSRGHNIC